MADDTRYRTLSLFSGIGGIDLGLRPWYRTVLYCERDPYAAGVLIRQMGQGYLDVAPIWDDVTTLGAYELEDIGPIEAIVGGFPCQDISAAGRQAGIVKGQTRSGLFYEIIRLIRLVRPRIVYLENVRAILNRGVDTVLGELAACGYDARWRVLSAAEVGANHLRHRGGVLPTPTVNMISGGPNHDSPSVKAGRHGLNLQGAVQMWPTPTDMSKGGAISRGGKRKEELLLAGMVQKFPTPRPCSGKGSSGMNRTEFYRLFWPTPKSSHSGPDYARTSREGSGGDDLATAVARRVPTPDANCWKGGNRKAQLTDPKYGITPNGGQLNPTWVEWLMGFPLGWTDLDV